MHFFRKSPAGIRFSRSLKFPFSWCAEPKREARFHFWSQISWNLMCAERKPEITLLHFRCSRLGLPQFQAIGTPTHYAAHFFLAAVAVPVHIPVFSTPPQWESFFLRWKQKKCKRRSHFSPRAPKLPPSFLPLQIRMRNPALFWQFCRAHDFQDCDAPNQWFQHHFFFNFKIFALSKTRFPQGRCRRMPEFASPRSAPITKKKPLS